MPRGLVLVIEDDEWVSSLLSGAIRDADYDVIVCNTAQAGLDTACDREPDCIICDIDLPDHDGYWVARNVRTQPSRVSITPFLFLSALDDQEARLEGFNVGADAYMTKPFRVDEVVAQVGALVQMASRLRRRRDSLASIPPSAPSASETTAIQGDLSQMSIATVLTVLELERRTGVVEVISKKRKATLEVATGFLLNASTMGGTPTETLTVLRQILLWKVGRFSFTPMPDRPPTAGAQGIGALLLEAVRLEDESNRDGQEMPHSSRRLAPPSIGGPSSRRDDLGPPSSKALVPSPLPKGAPQPEGHMSAGPISAPNVPAGMNAPHQEESFEDRRAWLDWGDLAAPSQPAQQQAYSPEAPPVSYAAESISSELLTEEPFGAESQESLEDQLTEVSEEEDEPALEQLIEESEEPQSDDYDQRYINNNRASLPGAPPRQPVLPAGARPPLRPGGTGPTGFGSPQRPPGPPPAKLTPMPRQPAAGLPGPLPRGLPPKPAGGLPGPLPRAVGPAGVRLPGPPPQKPLGPPARPSGEFPRVISGHNPPPPRNNAAPSTRGTPPPLPAVSPSTPPGPPPRRPTPSPGVAPQAAPQPRAPGQPPPRPPAASRPEALGETGTRTSHAGPPPLPPKQPPPAPRQPPVAPDLSKKR